MGMKLAAPFLLLLYFLLLTASFSAATNFDSVEVQERKGAENGVNEAERTGHGGRGDGGGGYAGSQGGGNGNGLQQPGPGTTLQNGGGTANYRNHPRQRHNGAAVHNYNCNLGVLTVFVTVSFSLLLHVSINF